jgi:hypothetical protein
MDADSRILVPSENGLPSTRGSKVGMPPEHLLCGSASVRGPLCRITGEHAECKGGPFLGMRVALTFSRSAGERRALASVAGFRGWRGGVRKDRSSRIGGRLGPQTGTILGEIKVLHRAR